jgi:hypothetical protein
VQRPVKGYVRRVQSIWRDVQEAQSGGSKGLDAKIWKEIKGSEESIMSNDRKARLVDSIEKKDSAMCNGQ